MKKTPTKASPKTEKSIPGKKPLAKKSTPKIEPSVIKKDLGIELKEHIKSFKKSLRGKALVRDSLNELHDLMKVFLSYVEQKQKEIKCQPKKSSTIFIRHSKLST